MQYPIYRNGAFGHVAGDVVVKSFREVTGFAVCNSLRNCLVKTQGGIWKICLDGNLRFVNRALNSMTFEDIYNAMKD